MAGVEPPVFVADDLFTTGDLSLLVALVGGLDLQDQDYGRSVIARRQRAVTDDARIPALLWQRLRPALPPLVALVDPARTGLRIDPPVDRWSPSGLNPRSRIYGYPMGAAFSEHEDEPWRPAVDRRTFLTVLVYLPCGGCEGGETVVDGTVVPVVDGRIVVFDHGLLHEGRPVERGRKLVLRTDVVFTS